MRHWTRPDQDSTTPMSPMPMTTESAAAEVRERFHDYRDLPGDEFYRALILLGFAARAVASWQFNVFHGVSAPHAITSGAASSSARRSSGRRWAC